VRTVRIRTAMAAPLALAGLGLGLGPGLAAPASAGVVTAQAAHSRPVVIDCENKAVTDPRSFVLACADGNDALAGMSWTSWTPKLASGYGTEQLNDCQPNCASGHFRNYPVLVVFWGGAAVKGHPDETRYTTYTLIYPGARPPHYSLVNGKVVITYPVSRTDPLWP
jgi:hypothetical protein